MLIAMPLYVHAMPGQVKALFEELEHTSHREGRRVGFVVQQGFASKHHSRWLEQVLAVVPERLGADYLGTAVRAGVEGIQFMPDSMTAKLYAEFDALGRQLGAEARLSDDVLSRLGSNEHLSRGYKAMFRTFRLVGVTDMHWNRLLKGNGAYRRRRDQPLFGGADDRHGH